MARINIKSQLDYVYCQMPKILFMGKNYKGKLKPVDIMVYTLLLDRLRLSIENNMIDKKGDIYLFFSTDELADILNVSEKSIRTTIAYLSTLELVSKELTGRVNRLYLHEPIFSDDDVKYIIDKDREYAKRDKTKQTKEEHQKRLDTYQKNKKISGWQNLPITEKDRQINVFSDGKSVVGKIYQSEWQNLPTNKNNINNNIYITNKSNESGNHLQTFQQPVDNKRDYFSIRHTGLDERIFNSILKWAVDDQQIEIVISALFKAKANVSKNKDVYVILFEEMTDEQVDDLSACIKNTLRIINQKDIQHKEAYLFSALKDYFEKIAICVESYHTENELNSALLFDYIQE
ncbi:replication initiator protein A [Carnobacteriaceae bacterium zg-ZUI78]|nr:replication initiator protein A [Carnobacteriaceae bacterium zg-ZUI78]